MCLGAELDIAAAHVLNCRIRRKARAYPRKSNTARHALNGCFRSTAPRLTGATLEKNPVSAGFHQIHSGRTASFAPVVREAGRLKAVRWGVRFHTRSNALKTSYLEIGKSLALQQGDRSIEAIQQAVLRGKDLEI